MARFLYRRHLSFGSFSDKWLFVVLSWIVGLVAGAACSASAGDSIVSLMCSAVQCRVSFISLLGTMILPFLISAFSVYVQAPFALYIVSFWKAFSHCFVFAGLCLAFPNSYWFIRWFLMFSDSLIIPVLFWFWLYILAKGSDRRLIFPVVTCSAAVFMITAIDYRIISAFLADLKIF